ncbi:hypothetical protein AcW2_000893 [Taiwanofungus camphoratus]|nr:hypothetical protein AcW2_000893 [Antrodia cinnamomea]
MHHHTGNSQQVAGENPPLPSSSAHQTVGSHATDFFQLQQQGWDPHSVCTPSLDPEDVLPAGPLANNSTTMPPTARPLLSHSSNPSPSHQGLTGSFRGAATAGAGDSHDKIIPIVSPHSRPFGAHTDEHPPMADPSSAHPRADLGQNPFATAMARDAAMAYAYNLYESPANPPPAGLTSLPLAHSNTPIVLSTENIYRFRLLPLLTSLRSVHPDHLPVLLLLACTYHALGEYESSLALCFQILAIDSTCVEAMSNVGVTYKALGRADKAYEWWWKALQLRPTYWDALDNILGLLFALAQSVSDVSRRIVYHQQALELCQYVQRRTVNSEGRLIISVPNDELHRLQRVYFTSATLRTLISSDDFQGVIDDYFKAVELVIRPPSPYSEEECYTTRDLLLSVCVAGYMLSAASNGPIPPEILASLDVDGSLPFLERSAGPGLNLLSVVHASGDRLVQALLHVGRGALPVLLLLPEQVMRSSIIIFPTYTGVLPSICTRAATSRSVELLSEITRQRTNLMTSTVVLTLAKRFQDDALENRTVPGFGGTIHISTSLVILLYYTALTLSPSPSAYNNLGILLSNLSSAMTLRNLQGQQHWVDGPMLARIYYQAGLQIDSTHPHLLTNLGSLLKDHGQLEQAIELYMRAIQRKPDFDIALANLGNAIKDMGRSWDAIEYYRRAVSVNPDLPEATCGLVNALCSICDWRGRGAVMHEVGVDDLGDILCPRQTGGAAHPGWITNMIEICDRQLNLGYTQSIGIIEKSGTLDQWLQVVESAKGHSLRPDERRRWTASFQRFFGKTDRVQKRINEAGFVLRFIDWVQPRLQRQWYIQAYGKRLSSEQPIFDLSSDRSSSFLRPPLPGNLDCPPTPSVLPFHTFTYPLSPRLARLIAHRNALRISYTAFSQSWLPRHVFHPPPPPVGGKLNIGYLSNDVNDHPLSHLMQSVFGFHDRDRFAVYLYTTSPWDGSGYRPKIATRVDHLLDVSSWPTSAIIEHILHHQIHILINLGGYTKGARNDIFAVRPCPIQIQLMGYAGTLAAGWCDYLVCCEVSCPRQMSSAELWRRLRRDFQTQLSPDEISVAGITFDLDADADPESPSDDWVYTEKLIYMPHTFMATDHKQSFREDENLSPEERAHTPVEKVWRDEERRRAEMRQHVFPDLPPDVVIFANFSQHTLASQVPCCG